MMSSDDSLSTAQGPVWEQIRSTLKRPVIDHTEWAAVSSVGRVRERNEDFWSHSGDSFFVLCDGMGGLEGGDVAARTAAEALVSAYETGRTDSWQRWMSNANMAVKVAGLHYGFERTGTAVVAAVLSEGIVTVAHVGDARAYRINAAGVWALTTDHCLSATLAVEGVESHGRSARELAALTRYLGSGDELAIPDVTSFLPNDGERLLLCTDGISGQIPDEDLQPLVMYADVEKAAYRLVEQADNSGGRDNATAVIIEFRST